MLDTCDYDMIKSQLNAFSLLYNVDTEKKDVDHILLTCYLQSVSNTDIQRANRRPK